MTALAYIAGQSKDHEATVAAICRIFEKQGHRDVVTRQSGDATIITAPSVATGRLITVEKRGLSGFVSGVLLYGNKVDETALDALLDDHESGSIRWHDLSGSFVCLLTGPARSIWFCDPLGNIPSFFTSDRTIFSTSFLAAARVCADRSLNEQAIYEYVFLESCFGGDTVLNGVVQNDPICAYELTNGTPIVRPEITPDRAPPQTFATQCDAVASCLHDSFEPLIWAFSGQCGTALSGGYDSRLILAILRSMGEIPKLHVYGNENAADVQVAKAICHGEGLTLEHVNKDNWIPDRPKPDVIERNFYSFDGLPTDSIFDNGSDLATRLHMAQGGLALNGGGGEIMRNFFYLPERAYRPADAIDAFYSRYHAGLGTTRFDPRGFRARLIEKWCQTLGVSPGQPIDRALLEFSYPAFRGRYWTSRNNAINNRLGASITPFNSPALVKLCAAIPMASKNAGRLEAAVLRLFDADLAAYPSDYGFDFASDPPHSYRLKDWINRQKPIWLRRRSFEIKAARSRPIDLAALIKDPAVFQALGPGLDQLAGLFDLKSQVDRGQAKRLLTMAYFLRWLADRT